MKHNVIKLNISPYFYGIGIEIMLVGNSTIKCNTWFVEKFLLHDGSRILFHRKSSTLVGSKVTDMKIYLHVTQNNVFNSSTNQKIIKFQIAKNIFQLGRTLFTVLPTYVPSPPSQPLPTSFFS